MWAVGELCHCIIQCRALLQCSLIMFLMPPRMSSLMALLGEVKIKTSGCDPMAIVLSRSNCTHHGHASASSLVIFFDGIVTIQSV